MRVLSLVNQKGGCGKTTTAIHLGAALARLGTRVLLVDLDPQGHATLGLCCDGNAGADVFDVLARGTSAREALQPVHGGLTLLPASARLAEFEEQASQALAPERLLRQALAPLAGEFELALLDCPPRADGVLTANALFASSLAVLVVETGAFALQGALRALSLLEETSRVQAAAFDLRVLATMFDRRTRFDREVLIALQSRFGSRMFETVVRKDVRLREAVASGRTVQELSPRSHAAADFAALAQEVLDQRLENGRELALEEAEPAAEPVQARLPFQVPAPPLELVPAAHGGLHEVTRPAH